MLFSQFVSSTQASLAAQTGLSSTHWSRIDNGQPVRESTINQIADRLGWQPHDVLRAINERRYKVALIRKVG